MPFDVYIEENIYKPLDIQRSTFRQPVPSELAPDMAVGYTYANGAYKTEEFEYFNGIMPAGSMSATSTDMAKFMIAHLQDGRYGDKRILQEATTQEMHRQHFASDPRINGICYGFFEGNLNNQKIIKHGGDTPIFHSLLVLLPEQNVGLFFPSIVQTAQLGPNCYRRFLTATTLYMIRLHRNPQWTSSSVQDSSQAVIEPPKPYIPCMKRRRVFWEHLMLAPQRVVSFYSLNSGWKWSR